MPTHALRPHPVHTRPVHTRPVLRDDDLSAAFDHAASTYDLLVGAHPGYHSQLRRSARRLGLPSLPPGSRLLDLGCGTGASTAALLASGGQRCRITAADASAGMLERAATKRWPANVTFVHTPADRVGDVAADGPFDAVFAAYLFRNVTDTDGALAAVLSAMAPGGRIAVHEYTLSGSPVHRAAWSAVCRGVVMPLGRATGNAALYAHLWRSVVAFDTAPRFAERMRRAGFADVRALPLAGWQGGITHTFVARAPRRARPAA
ncbi:MULTISPECIES: class I SAM-dependent methyltransferase [unclassified Streptomyces]|uniref:class I SAM-dependent methyltransferase n=1 Tax=unclassified Streptomyces TaxID=2593676 RepID=UPI002E325DFF|nr:MULTISPECIES: class I SAM-dependent methyltransferase [unclassified Streptomyces]WUC68144.1 class I SAM-dependent methyltransferase [Streptomyces sp. NBC_00539]